jgi:hypothetical protein
MELSPSRDVTSRLATQGIPSILWKTNVHFHVNKILPLAPIVSHMNSAHTPVLFLSTPF